jgi:hypothetical protein
MGTDNHGAEDEIIVPNALIPGHLTYELDVPADPEWLSNDTPHTLLEIDLGQIRITLSKTSVSGVWRPPCDR